MDKKLRYWLYNIIFIILLIYSNKFQYGIVYYVYLSIIYILGLRSLLIIHNYFFDYNTYDNLYEKLKNEIAINYYNINLLNMVNIVYILMLFHFKFYFTSIFVIFSIISENMFYKMKIEELKIEKQ